MPPLSCLSPPRKLGRTHRYTKARHRRRTIGVLERCEDRILLTTTFGITAGPTLIQFDSATPSDVSSKPITNLGASETIQGIDFRPANGQLYALTTDATNVGRLYTLDTTSGAATLASTINVPLTGSSFGVDFNPVPDRLRIVSDADLDLRVDVSTGTAVVDGTLAFGGNDVNAGQNPNAVGSAYINSFAGSSATTLYQLDPSLGILAIQNPPNSGTLLTVGPLGINAGSVIGFDVLTTGDKAAPINQAIAALQVGGTTGLYTVNLSTGQATFVGAIGNGVTPVLGLAVAPDNAALVNAANAFGVDTSNNLVRFNIATPGTIVSTVPITGIQPSESIVSLDFRPNNNVLYALGSTGRIYSIDQATGVATAKGSGPFTPGLSGGGFDIDFNPTVDRLRLVSDTGQDLRLNVDTGAVVAVDGTLAYATGDPNFGRTPAVGGAAYVNNLGGALTTTLYDIDIAQDVLAIQNPPNSGTLVTVGSLGVDAEAVVGFDIRTIGGQQFGYASLVVGGTTGLYKIHLSTGSASLIGQVGVTTRTFAIAPDGFTASLSGSTATFTGGFNGDSLTIDQSGGLLRHNQFALGAPGYNSAFDFDSNTPGDQTLSATDPAVAIVVNGGPGNDLITLGSSVAPLGSLVANFTVNGQEGSNELTLDDASSSTGRTITVTGSQVTGLGGSVSFSDLSALRVNGGSGDDTFAVAETFEYSLFKPAVNGGAGSDVLNADARGASVIASTTSLRFLPISTYTGVVSFENTEQVNVTNVQGVPLAPTSPSPTVSAVAGTEIIDAIVARFNDIDAGAKPSDYQVTINWGDGSSSAGTVVQDANDPTLFNVKGSHLYATPGNFSITSSIIDTGGVSTLSDQGVTVTSTFMAEPAVATSAQAVVTSEPITVTGRLDAASDTGVSNSDNITNDITPTFVGTATAGFAIRIYDGTDPATRQLIASTFADTNGFWQATATSPLADGIYTNLSVEATGTNGVPSTSSSLASLTIDTVGPTVSSLDFRRLRRELNLTIQDERSGLDQGSLTQLVHYSLVGRVLGARRLRTIPVSQVSTTPVSGPGTQFLRLVLNNGRRFGVGRFTFTARSGGIRDVAGNGLDGEFVGGFPSGNRQPGGDFIVDLRAARKPFPPQWTGNSPLARMRLGRNV